MVTPEGQATVKDVAAMGSTTKRNRRTWIWNLVNLVNISLLGCEVTDRREVEEMIAKGHPFVS